MELSKWVTQTEMSTFSGGKGMEDYKTVNDLNNSEFLTIDQARRFEWAKTRATKDGHAFLTPEWKAAWSEYFGEL